MTHEILLTFFLFFENYLLKFAFISCYLSIVTEIYKQFNEKMKSRKKHYFLKLGPPKIFLLHLFSCKFKKVNVKRALFSNLYSLQIIYFAKTTMRSSFFSPFCSTMFQNRVRAY